MQKLNFFWKVFIALSLVILISLFVMSVAFRLSLPSAFTHHMINMDGVTGGRMGMGRDVMEGSLYYAFDKSVSESLWVAIPIALVISLLASWLISRQVAAPMKRLFVAAQRIAGGQYHERIPLPDQLSENQMDDIQRLSHGFNNMATSLEQTETMRRQLIGDISHELRTPLTTIKGSLEGLMDGVLTADKTTLELIHGEADRLQRLVEDLQELSRMEGGAYTLNLQPVNLAETVYRISVRMKQLFLDKNIVLENQIPPYLNCVLADSDRLDQILVNLISNAIHYTQPGGQIEISTKQINDKIQVAVRDNGIGITAEHLPHIFTRFYRIDKSRARPGGGSGIGLTVTKHLVEAHGGSIQVESPGTGKGSTFSFTLPLAN
jgi:histidine kinase